MKRRQRTLMLLIMMNDLFTFLLGAEAAFVIEEKGDGVFFVVPLMILLVALGWIFRGLVEGCRK